MAFLIPSYIQKRLLRYALSHFPVVDTDTLDLEQLDIAWGKRSSVELRDVGLHVKKLSHMLHLPDELQPTKARIISLRITVPADIYSSGIVVDVQGIDIQVRLDRPRDDGKGTATPKTPKHGSQRKRARVQAPRAEQEEDDHLPTAQELAQSFLDEEPAVERQELEEAIQNAGLLPSDESDNASEASDEDNTGTGVGLAVPAFLANFLKGVIDRLQMSISNVKFILDAELPPDDHLPTGNPALSLQFGVSSVAIDGFTHNSRPDSGSGSNERDQERRRVRLQGIYGDLITEGAMFTSLERVSTASHHYSTSSSNASPRASRGSGQHSARHVSPSLGHQSRGSRTAASDTSHSMMRSTHHSLADSRMSSASSNPLQSSIHSEDRFANASDDGRGEMDESIHQSQMYASSSLVASHFTPSELAEDVEEDLPFMMEDARSSHGYESQELDPFAALSCSLNQSRDFSPPSIYSRQRRKLAATAPMTPLRSTDSYQLDRRRPIYSSQPVPRSSREPPLHRSSTSHHQLPSPQPSPPKSDSSGSPSEGADASLAQSMMFSHEEAESMYMSALSEARSEQYNVPGGWGQNSNSSDDSNGRRDQTSTNTDHHFMTTQEVEGSGAETPRPRSPSNASSSPDSKFRNDVKEERLYNSSPPDILQNSTPSPRVNTVSKRVFSIDELLVWLPWSTPSEGPESVAAGEVPIPRSPPQQKNARHMPGAFSQYQSVFSETFKGGQKGSMHTRFDTSSLPEDSLASLPSESMLLPTVQEPDVAIEIDNAICNLDTSSTRLLYRLVQQVMEVWTAQPQQVRSKQQEAAPSPTMPSCHLTLGAFTFGFMENLPAQITQPAVGLSRSSSSLADPLFQATIEGLSMSNTSAGEAFQLKLDLQTFKTGYPGEPIISFEKSPRRQSISKSKILAKEPDVKIVFKSTPSRGPELDIITLPVLLALNLQKLDDRLLLFGGVSGMLDLGSSVASNSTVLAPSPVAKSKPGNVRFGGDPVLEETPALSPIKVNARFYGIKVLLEGRACAVKVDTGTLAVTVRKDTARVRIEHIKLRAPFDACNPETSAFTVDVVKSDIRFLLSGVEEDFESLVSLIEPSGDRYEEDDGFLLDMLKRQRKNGSVLRVEVADVLVNVSHLEHTDRLQQLADELARLSSGVTKYLPEDDRPGILILPKIAVFHIQARVNESLGLLEASCEDIRVAHVGVPFLLGFKIGPITANRDGDVVLDPLLQLDAKTPTPSIMGRFIGNVPESRIKLKFFNLLVEYKIPTILAILGISDAETVEDLAMSMAASVATIRGADSSPAHSELHSPTPKSVMKDSKQPLRLDVLIRDCAVGLNPAKSDAKALFLLSQAQMSADEEGKDGFRLGLHLNRASLLLIDDVEALDVEVTPAPRPYDSDNLSPAVDDLTRQGFQPVASIWSGQTTVNISKDDKDEALIDVNLNNKLFTLETCADSQQTLAAVLNGLAPPLPKKEEQMYRTHVVPIENMMASFTGEAFVQSETGSANEPTEEGLNMEDADQILEDIPSNMDFVGSFYDPDDDTGYYSPSVLGSVNRLSSRLLAPARNDKVSFADSIEEQFEHGPDNVLIDPSENYLEVFKFKAPVRRWNSKTASLEPIYEADTHNFPIKVTAKFEQITWNLYDGYDWASTRDKIAQAVEKVEAQVEQRRRARRTSVREDDDAESEIADMLFQSIWIAVPPNADERDLRRGINRQIADEYSETASTQSASVDTRTTGGRPIHRRRKSKTLHLERSRRKISFDLQKVVADLLVPPSGSEETQNALALRIGEFEIYDHVPSSTWKKFLTYLHDAGERQMGKPMIRLDAITVKPVADLAATEMIIKASLLPIRLHVDQDALDFMTRFFDFKDERAPPSTGAPGPYIARLEVNTVPVKLDYKPKKVDYAGLRSGSTSEFANFVILDRAEFQLKRLILYGVQSPDLLQPKLKGIWTADVINNQLPTVLAGLSGIRPLVDVGSGIRDLVVVPMREYRKDGRIVRSIQKGAVAFAKTTTSELARLGAKVAISTQTVLEGAEGLLAPTYDKRNRSRSGDEWDVDDFSASPAREEPRAVSNYADQPLNVVTGLRDAWQGLERDLATAKDAIIAISGDVRESGSAVGAMGAVARLAPTVILRPAIGATRGVGMALLGAGNMLDKDSRRKIEDKYKRY